MIPLKADVLITNTLPAPAGVLKTPASGRSSAENCARIRDLGFTTSKHIKMYGEGFELVSDPFEEGDCTAVRAINGNNPAIRVPRLPVSIILGLAHRFRKS
jgi:hypothetical protein